MSSDIVKRLRQTLAGSIHHEAADRIEALEREVALLKTERRMREDWITRISATLEKAEARAERLQVECAENERLWNEATNLAELNGEVADSAMKRAERLRAALTDIWNLSGDLYITEAARKALKEETKE